jgi:hypothetical protein
MRRVRVAPSRNIVFTGNETFKINTRPLGYHKTTTSTIRSNLSHEKETKSVENSKNLGGRGFGFRKKENFRGLIKDQSPQTSNCSWPREPSAIPGKDFHGC